MTKEEIINELNVIGFKDQSVLAVIDMMADGAMWMQKRMINKASVAMAHIMDGLMDSIEKGFNDVVFTERDKIKELASRTMRERLEGK